MKHSLALACTAAALLSTQAVGDISYRDQSRRLNVFTSANADAQAVESTTLDPFNQTLAISTVFHGVGGPVTNLASGRIDCQIRPTSIRATGELAGAGGIAQATGLPETGEADIAVLVTFDVTEPVPYSLLVAPRPSADPTDEFEVELKQTNAPNNLFAIDNTTPPQAVNTGGVLSPGTYQFKYKVECSSGGEATLAAFNMDLTFGCVADINESGDTTIDDVYAFLGLWMTSAPSADINHDALISIQDVFDFLTVWFRGCA